MSATDGNGRDYLQLFKQSYERARSEGPTGDVSLDALLMSMTPAARDLVLLLSVPHWFNDRLVSLLSRATEPTVDEGEAYEALRGEIHSLSFVRPHGRGFALHDAVRARLRASFIARAPQRLRDISTRLVDYLAARHAEEQREELEWERVYHLVACDEEQGLTEFDGVFMTARQARRTTVCHTLAEMLAEQSELLSERAQPWIDYYRGLVLYDQHQRRTAGSVFEALAAGQVEPPLSGRIYLYQGLSAEAHEDWPRAESIYASAIDQLNATDDKAVLARLHQRLAEVHIRENHLKKAEAAAKRSLELNEQTGDQFGLALNRRALGRIRTMLYDPNAARRELGASMVAMDAAGRRFAKATIHTDLAKLEQSVQRLEQAEEHFNAAIDLKVEGGDNFGLAILYADLGQLKLIQRRFDEAQRAFDRSLSLFRRFGDRLNEARTMHNKSLVHEQSREVEEAIACEEKAIAMLADEGRSADSFQKRLDRLRRKQRWRPRPLRIALLAGLILGLLVLYVILYAIVSDPY